MPVHSWVAAVISGEASWSQGKGAASTGWPPPYIFEEETHTWDGSTFPPCLSYYLELVTQRQRLPAFPWKCSFQTLTMKPMPEKTTCDSFPTAPRASPGKVLTTYLLNKWETNKRLQILLATFSSPSLSEPSARVRSWPRCRLQSSSSFPTTAMLLAQHCRSTSCSQQVRAPPLLTALTMAGSRQCCPQATQFSQAPVLRSTSAVHTSGCHTESSEGKKEWPRHPLRQVLRKEERLGGKGPHISQSRRQGVHSSFPEAFLLFLPQSFQQQRQRACEKETHSHNRCLP